MVRGSSPRGPTKDVAGSNAIADIDGIGELTRMRRLFLDRNRLQSIAGVAPLAQLEELDLGDNPLAEVDDLAGLQRLQRLDLSRTSISGLGGVLTPGDLEVLRLHGDLDLACEAIRLVVSEFGAAAVRYDKDCGEGT